MPQTKQKKSELIEELKKLFDKASILVFVNFHGLSVAKERKLRKVFRLSEIKYKVSKKTLLKRVLDAVGFTDVPKLEGEVGVAAGWQDWRARLMRFQKKWKQSRSNYKLKTINYKLFIWQI